MMDNFGRDLNRMLWGIIITCLLFGCVVGAALMGVFA